jgi:hypothetical protein
VRDDIRFDGREDDAIERTLAGLRQVDPPAGLEDRVLQTMRDKMETAKEPVDSNRWPGWASWAGFGLAVATALLMIAVALHGHSGSKNERQAASAPATRLPETTATANASRNEFDEAASVRPARRQVHQVVRETHPKHLASFPAPEPPLTEEEKILQRIARSGDQQQLAVLNPELRAKDEAASEAEFKQFEQNRNEENTRRTDNESSQNE